MSEPNCPKCGEPVRCSYAFGGCDRVEWACGSHDYGEGEGLHQSADCRIRELEREVVRLRGEVRELRTKGRFYGVDAIVSKMRHGGDSRELAILESAAAAAYDAATERMVEGEG